MMQLKMEMGIKMEMISPRNDNWKRIRSRNKNKVRKRTRRDRERGRERGREKTERNEIGQSPIAVSSST